MTIVEELKKSRESGAKRLENEYKAGLMILARGLCADSSDAEELVNRTFAAVVQGIDGFLEQSSFFTWMCRILNNIHATDCRRKASRCVTFPGDVPDVEDDAAKEAVYANLDAAFLRDAIKTLPAGMREVIVLHYLMDLPVARVAKFLTLPVSTVKWRLHCARLVLSRRLGATAGDFAQKLRAKPLIAGLALTAVFAAVAGLTVAHRGGGAILADAVRTDAETAVSASGRAASPGPPQTGEVCVGVTGGGQGLAALPSSEHLGCSTGGEEASLRPNFPIQQEVSDMKTSALLAAPLAALSLAPMAAPAAVKSITDTSGYVVLKANDGYGKSSLATGLNFEGTTPVSTKDYLIQKFGARSPGDANSKTTFGGRSLTLDEGGAVTLKGKPSSLTIADLRAYDSMISHGEGGAEITLAGGISVLGTSATPLVIQGSGAGGPRKVQVNSIVTGVSGSRILVNHSTENDADGAQYFVFFNASNSGYAGDFRVEGGQNGVCLCVGNNSALGPANKVTLVGGNARLFGGTAGHIPLNNANIVLEGGGTLGVFRPGNNGDQTSVGFSIGDGSTISGTGTLEIRASGNAGYHFRRTQLANVNISGIDGIKVYNGSLQLSANYSNPTVPIDVTQAVMLRTVGGCNVGPVTLRDGAYMLSARENVTLASLTMTQSGADVPYIVKALRNGLVTITGDLVNNLPSGSKIRFSINDETDAAGFTAGSYRLLTAANLGKDGGPSPDDFEIVPYDGTPESVAKIIAGGAFSFEEADGKTYLVYTIAKTVVSLTGNDGSGNAADGSSFNASARWSDTKLPHADAAYVVPSGKLLRAPDGQAGTFPDTSLTILEGGTFSAQGATVTVPDLLLMGGSILNATRPQNSVVAGKVTVSSTTATPAYVQLEVQKTASLPRRDLTIAAPVSGTGVVRFRYNPSAAADHAATDGRYGFFYLTGNNAGYTGEWQPAHWCVKTVFKDAAAVGGASYIHFLSAGVLLADSTYTIPASVKVNVDEAGSNSANTAKTNGGTFEVADGQTLTVAGVVSGNGILRKDGAGTLRLTAANTKTGQMNVKAGTLLVDGSLANGTANVIVRTGAFLGGVGTVKTVELEDGAGLAVSAGQTAPVSIDTLTIDGGVALALTDGEGDGRFAVAKIGAVNGTLPEKASARFPYGRVRNVRLSLKDGVLYADEIGMTLILR